VATFYFAEILAPWLFFDPPIIGNHEILSQRGCICCFFMLESSSSSASGEGHIFAPKRQGDPKFPEAYLWHTLLDAMRKNIEMCNFFN
jgi:hypothetical protein